MALVPVEEALSRILKTAIVLASESVPLDLALERVTSNSVLAKRDQPPFDASAMMAMPFAFRTRLSRCVLLALLLLATAFMVL